MKLFFAIGDLLTALSGRQILLIIQTAISLSDVPADLSYPIERDKPEAFSATVLTYSEGLFY
jgi:hypothetical protein